MPDIRGGTVLVIGGAGFIGFHVVDALIQEDVAQQKSWASRPQ